jgi:hypothetical protein
VHCEIRAGQKALKTAVVEPAQRAGPSPVVEEATPGVTATPQQA